MNKFYTVFFAFLLISSIAFGQDNQRESTAQAYILNNTESLEVSEDDVSDLIITDSYTSSHNGVTHIYFNQAYNGIPIRNAIANINLTKDDQIVYVGNRLVSDLEARIEHTVPQINAVDALILQLEEAGLNSEKIPPVVKRAGHKTKFAEAAFSQGNIIADLMYVPTGDKLTLTYEVKLLEKSRPHFWHTLVDAVTGELIKHSDETLYCSFENNHYHNHSASCRSSVKMPLEGESAEAASGSYRVYALPTESPVHGPHELIAQPHDITASPFGWHDVDGVDGADFTITRGNNVHAFRDGDDTGISSGDEPDGGVDLIFDFPHDNQQDPSLAQEADITNLFYMNNMMHDISYLLGFDEAAGNFQNTNYKNQGQAGDYVLAQGQDGANLLDADHTNNANFSTPGDGNNGRMQMYFWSQQASSTSIDEPTEIAGDLEVTVPTNGQGDWGFNYVVDFSSVSITEKVVIADDGSFSNPTQGCRDFINTDEMEGNIAMIDRGSCEFGTKSLNAQNAGAVAVLICNVPGVNGGDGEEGVNMSGGDDGPNVIIPSIFLKYSDCQRIKASINAGVDVVVTIMERENEGPDYYSSSFDNGVIAHEYGHGISTRLTGGPSNSGCLPSFDDDGDGYAERAEQMGEGWSDFFALIMTTEPGDTGGDVRGVGVYLEGENPGGRGIRRFPYSNDMNVNPQTMDDIVSGSGVHQTGEVWSAVLWDMYWAFIDVYGFDADWTNTESGNFKAVQLVIDGMKLQPCAPGFMDGRDAILAADQVNHGGIHQCMIWDVFARRGMGVFADQVSTLTQRDNIEDFTPLATCIKELKISKDIAEILVPGEETEVVLTYANHTEAAIENVLITDEIPDNAVFVSQNSSFNVEVIGNTVVFEVGTLESLDEGEIRYTIQSDAGIKSAILYSDDNEDPDLNDQNWEREIIEGLNFWQQSGLADFSYSGFNSWYISEVAEATKSDLIYKKLSVVGEKPTLRFWHKYNTAQSTNGGFIEISTDGQIWKDVTRSFIRNKYPTTINYSTFAIPALEGFSGNSETFIDSYVDLSEYKDQDISIRFKFGTDVTTNTFAPDNGWFVDDIDLIDLLEYQTQACIAGDGESGCSAMKKSFVEASIITSNEDIAIQGVELSLNPNPAGDYTAVSIRSDRSFNGQLSVTSMDGRLVDAYPVQIHKSNNDIIVNTASIPAGIYIVQLQSGDKILSEKLIVQ